MSEPGVNNARRHRLNGLMCRAAGLVLVGLLTGSVPGQGVADLARRNRAKHKRAAPSRVYTNRDLQGRKGRLTTSTPGTRPDSGDHDQAVPGNKPDDTYFLEFKQLLEEIDGLNRQWQQLQKRRDELEPHRFRDNLILGQWLRIKKQQDELEKRRDLLNDRLRQTRDDARKAGVEPWVFRRAEETVRREMMERNTRAKE